MSDTVATPNAAWHAMAQDRQLIHDLMGGTRAMRRAGERWLPREPGETTGVVEDAPGAYVKTKS